MKERSAVVAGALMGGLGMLLAGAGLLVTAVSGPAERPYEKTGTFGTSVITVDVGTLPSSDCWVEVGMRDVDGKQYGDKVIETETLCP